LTKVNGPENSDANTGIGLVTTDPTLANISESPVEVLGDSAYATGAMLHALDQVGWTPLVKPWPIKPAVEGGFTIDDFTHDPDAAHGAGTLTCPAGQTRVLTRAARPSSGSAVGPARCEHGAPPPKTAAPSRSTPTTCFNEHTAHVPPIPSSKRPTGPNGRWSSGRSPG
jgi:hypothetical protein